VELVRLNHHSDLKAIFTGILSEGGRDVSGQVVNSQGALAHLLGTKFPIEIVT
jgi:hypothetical protein